MTQEAYMNEWRQICAAYCKKEGARLLFVNSDNFGIEYPDGRFCHIYADELERILSKDSDRQV